MVPTLRAVRSAAKPKADSESRILGLQSSGCHCGCAQTWQKETRHSKPTELQDKFIAEGSSITGEGRKDTRSNGQALQKANFLLWFLPSFFPQEFTECLTVLDTGDSAVQKSGLVPASHSFQTNRIGDKVCSLLKLSSHQKCSGQLSAGKQQTQ